MQTKENAKPVLLVHTAPVANVKIAVPVNGHRPVRPAVHQSMLDAMAQMVALPAPLHVPRAHIQPVVPPVVPTVMPVDMVQARV